MRHAGAPQHTVDPSLHEREQRLKRAHRVFLLGSVFTHAHIREIERTRQRIGVEPLDVAQLVLHRIQIDGDAAGVFAD